MVMPIWQSDGKLPHLISRPFLENGRLARALPSLERAKAVEHRRADGSRRKDPEGDQATWGSS